jgi:DNA polymerase III epsilon subunit-like protein
LNLARNVLAKGTVKNYKLGTLGDYYGIEFGAHAAHEDVAATATLMQILFRELCEMYNDESNKPNVMLVKPKIRSIIFWEGYRGFSRIYVYTDSGTVYYDIRCHHWGGKDVDLSEIDMEYIEQESFRLTNTDSEETFGKFKGKIAV